MQLYELKKGKLNLGLEGTSLKFGNVTQHYYFFLFLLLSKKLKRKYRLFHTHI
jgi:hypothetical protein